MFGVQEIDLLGSGDMLRLSIELAKLLLLWCLVGEALGASIFALLLKRVLEGGELGWRLGFASGGGVFGVRVLGGGGGGCVAGCGVLWGTHCGSDGV